MARLPQARLLNIPIPDPSEETKNLVESVKQDLRREFDDKVSSLGDLLEEKFTGLRFQLEERSKRTDQTIAAGISERNTMIQFVKDMAEAQRKASEQAITKSEASTSSDLSSLRELMNSGLEGVRATITTLTDRVSRAEYGDRAIKESKVENHMTAGTILAIIAGVVGLLSLIVSGVIASHGFSSNPTVGADTKRVDDLIAAIQTRDRDTTSRFDALSARLNGLTSQLRPPAPTATPTPTQQ